MNRLSPTQSRREFFAGALRYGALGGLAAAGALAVAKRRRLIREGRCINEGLCLGCAAYHGCNLPTALDLKRSLERGEHGPAK